LLIRSPTRTDDDHNAHWRAVILLAICRGHPDGWPFLFANAIEPIAAFFPEIWLSERANRFIQQPQGFQIIEYK
jgi:hypothetical protein